MHVSNNTNNAQGQVSVMKAVISWKIRQGATKNEVDISTTTVMGLLTHTKNEYVIYLILKK